MSLPAGLSTTTVTHQAPSAGTPAVAEATRVRPEIQGLRAIAVMLVVLYHLWPKRLTGGYIGVDVFFVISGFLITAHLVRDAERHGRVRLGQFWARRARRLLPASLLVLGASLVATYVWVPVALWQHYAREIGAAGLYVLNWVLAADSVDYLAADNTSSPALHYWSLSVEEQFYLVWPLLIALALWLALRARRRPAAVIAAVLGVLTAASFVWSIHLTGTSPARAYFVTPVRAWQFGAGALLALLVAAPALERRWDAAVRTRAAVSWLGLAAIAWGAVSFTAATPFPGTAALVPVLGALAVIAAGSSSAAWSPARMLALRPAQVLGDISYSTYLWHWPPIVILPFVLGRALDAKTKLVLLAVVLVLAWLTKRWVEDPVRTTHRFGLRRPSVTFGAMLVAMVAVVALCAAMTHRADVEASKALAEEQQISQSRAECFGAASMDPSRPQCPTAALAGVVVPDPSRVSGDSGSHKECWVVSEDSDLTSCTFGDATGSPDVPHIALVGDSHARAWLPAFVELADQHKIVVDTYLKASCAWSTTVAVAGEEAGRKGCAIWRTALEKKLLSDAGRYDAIVTAGFSAAKLIYPADAGDRAVYRADGLLAAWTPLLDAGDPVIALRDNPIPGTDPNECLRTDGKGDSSRCDLPRERALEFPDPQVDAVERTGGRAHLVDLTDMYCTATTCPVVIGGANVYRDRHHMTATYSATLAPYLWRQLSAILEDVGQK